MNIRAEGEYRMGGVWYQSNDRPVVKDNGNDLKLFCQNVCNKTKGRGQRVLYHRAGYITTTNAGYIWGSPIVGKQSWPNDSKGRSEGGLGLIMGVRHKKVERVSTVGQMLK